MNDALVDWKEVKLGDVCFQITDGVHNTVKDDSNGKYFLLSCKNLKNGNVVIGDKERKINFDTFQALRKRTKTEKGDVLLSSVGTIGELAIIKDNNPIYEFQRSVALLKPNNAEVSSNFLYYTLYDKKDLLISMAEGAVQQCLFLKPLKEFNVTIPPLDIQKKIAGILGVLDDKIELNNQINNNLEQQAKALFKSWFVDFEPFGGKMPSDWEIYKLGDFLPVITGKKNANVSSSKGKYPFFSCSQDIAWTDDYSFEGNAILVAGNGDFNVKFYNGKFEAYQRTYVLIPKEARFTDWLYYAVKHNLSDITSMARGSVISFITKGNLENFSFSAPKDLNSCSVIDIFQSINKTILNNINENYRLAELRDTLLPKLMSGEIDVSNVDISKITSTDKLSFSENKRRENVF